MTRHLVDPELVAALDLVPQFVLDDTTLAEKRAFVLANPVPEPDDGLAVEERTIPGPPGAPDLTVLIYRPPGLAPGAPGLLRIHGGGYVVGSPASFGAMARLYARGANCVVVSTSYRLAPETRWPGPVEDCHAALSWFHANAEELGVDPARIAVAGESAGGGLAAALALVARNRGGPPILFQLLVYPMLDDRSAHHPLLGRYVWDYDANRYGWRAFLGAEPGGDDVPEGAVPARVADLSGLPPAYITVGALDQFVVEDMDYARRLIEAGVPAELRVVPGAWHGFDIWVPDAEISRGFIADANRALRTAFARATAAPQNLPE